MRLLLVGDGIGLTTGFAQVLRHIAKGAVARGWTVGQIASLEQPTFFNYEPYSQLGVQPFIPDGENMIGLNIAGPVVERFKPDVILINADPGTARHWFAYLEQAKVNVPTVLYAPVEGAPINPTYAESFKAATKPFSYTDWSSRALKGEWSIDAPYVYHGVDPSVFHPLDEGRRRSLRKRLGWEGRFVIMYVARNSGRKQHPRLLQALAHLQSNGEDDDALLYLHCQPFDAHWNQGWNLQHVAAWCQISERVQFQETAEALYGEPATSLATKMACADLYIHVAQVEGFGLPILEAMACGLPVIIPKDDGNMMEVVGAGTTEKGMIQTGAAAAIVVHSDVETWFNGAQLVNLSPKDIAHAIYVYRRDLSTKAKEIARQRGIERATSGLFSWERMANVLLDGCVSAQETFTSKMSEALV